MGINKKKRVMASPLNPNRSMIQGLLAAMTFLMNAKLRAMWTITKKIRR